MSSTSAHDLSVLHSPRARRHPFWLEASRMPVAAWLHLPVDRTVRAGGVLVCPPFGYEYTHAHRALLHTADALAEAGHAALRIDYVGTGASAGDERTPDLFARWLESIEVGLDRLEQLTGGGPASVVGLRLGATLAGRVAQIRPVRGFVAWAPVVAGKRYVRELRTLQRMATSPSEASDGFVEAGGFRLGHADAERLGGIDLTSTPIRAHGALVVHRSDQPVEGRFVQALSGWEVATTEVRQDDFLDMVAEPQFTRVPTDTILGITRWLSDMAGDGRALADLSSQMPSSRSVSTPSGSGFLREELCVVPQAPSSPPLFGVLCEPHRLHPESGIIVLCNSGSVHHVGPNRFYVELSRMLGEAGIPTFRFDLRNLGDSNPGSGDPDENHPYPATAVEDTRRVIQWLRAERGYPSAIVAGLCSGAHTTFHLGRSGEGSAISGLVCINPLTFYYQRGMPLDTPASYQIARDARYYEQAIWDPARWKRLLRGQSDLRYIASFVVKRAGQKAGDLFRRALKGVGLRARGRLETDLEAIAGLGRTIHFIFSSTDPGHEILMRQARRTVRRLERRGAIRVSVIPSADHTFSTAAWRRAAISAVESGATTPATALQLQEWGPSRDLWNDVGSAWKDLYLESEESSPFLHPTWIEQWLRCFGESMQTRALAWFDDGEPVGCVLLSSERAHIGPLPVVRTFLNAAGGASVGCEHNDVLARPDRRRRVMAELVSVLRASRLDELALMGVRPRLLEEITGGWSTGNWNGHSSESPYVDLARVRREGGDYLATLSGNKRGQIRRSIRKYEERFGDQDVEIASTEAEALEWLDELAALHRARWRAVGEHGALGEGEMAFHRGLLARLTFGGEAAQGLTADLVRVRYGDLTIGLLYNLVLDGRVYFYQSGLRYHDDPHLKPGLVAHALTIQRCVDRGDLEYDFLGGEAEPVRYKRSLTTDIRTLYWARVPAASLKMRLIERLRRSKRSLQAAQQDG